MSSFRDSIRDSNGGAYLLFFTTLLAFALISAAILLRFGAHVSTVASEVLVILGAAFVWRWIMKDAAADWPSLKMRVSPATLGITLVTAVVLGFLANGTMSFIVEISPFMKELAESYSKMMSELVFDASGWERVLGVIGLTIAAPICEEALFRGTILCEQRKKEKVWVAVVINGLLFSAFHVNLVSAIGLWFIGSYLAHITIRSGSLIPAIVAHAALNTTNGVILPELFPRSTHAEMPIDLLELSGLIVVLGALSVFLWRWSVHRMKDETDSTE